MTEQLINRVEKSGLLQVDFEEWLGDDLVKALDLAEALEQGILLREMTFRSWVKELDLEAYRGFTLAITCSTDALIPNWAYMLLANHLTNHGLVFYVGSIEQVYSSLLLDKVQAVDVEDYRDQRVVVKGCSTYQIHPQVYAAFASRLTPVVRSLSFGEPCSTVPIFKRKK